MALEVLENIWVVKALVALCIIVLGAIIYRIIKGIVFRQMKAYRRDRQYQSIMRKILKYAFVLVLFILIVITFGYDLTNIGIAIGGILGLVAIGFVATWSILSNIVSTLLILAIRPYEIDDYIKVLPDNVEGYVDEINLFFTILKDKKNQYTHIPNNLMFQKYLVHVRGKDKR